MSVEDTAQMFKLMFLGYLEGCDKVIGEVKQSYTEDVPDGWLPLEGGTFDAVDYPLFLTFCPQFDNEDGTFTLPNHRNRYIAAAAQNPLSEGDYQIGQEFGQNTVTLTTSQIPSHSHNAGFLPISQAGTGANSAANPLGGGVPVSTTFTGGGLSHENRPPTIAVYFWIVAR